MVTSALWAAEDALATLLEAADLGAAKFTHGTPTKFGRDNVWIDGEVEEWQAEWQVSGLGAKDETFGLKVVVLCARAALDYVTPRNAVRDLAVLVEDAIAADHTLGGTVELAATGTYRKEEALLDDQTRAVKLTLTVRCRAWAT